MRAAVWALKCDGMSRRPPDGPSSGSPPTHRAPNRREARQRLRQAALAHVSACLEAFDRGDRPLAARHALAAGRALLLLALRAPMPDRK